MSEAKNATLSIIGIYSIYTFLDCPEVEVNPGMASTFRYDGASNESCEC